MIEYEKNIDSGNIDNIVIEYIWYNIIDNKNKEYVLFIRLRIIFNIVKEK